MERQLKEAQQQAGMPHEKAAVSNQQEAIISALRSELHQERVQHNELKDVIGGHSEITAIGGDNNQVKR